MSHTDGGKGFAEILRHRGSNLRTQVTAVCYAYRDPRVKLLPKLLILFTLGYALSPVDLIPDFIPVLGYLDDLVILPALMALSIRLIPKDVWEESRRRAAEEPLTLRKNWLFGALFVLVWIVMLLAVVSALIPKRTGNP